MFVHLAEALPKQAEKEVIHNPLPRGHVYPFHQSLEKAL